MKKKQQQQETVVNESNVDIDIKSLIRENAVFFDKLIELIPAKFYLPADDSDKMWFKGLSKSEKAKAKKESRENIKKARRDRLDPDKSSETTLDLLMKNLEKEKEEDDEEEEEKEVEDEEEEKMEINPMMSGLQEEDGNKAATYEELRQRLRRKIEELRGGRNTGVSERAKKRNERKGIQQKKRKRESETDEKKSSKGKVDKDSAESSKDFKFSNVKLGDEEHEKKKKRKISKQKELERAKQLSEAMKDPEKGDVMKKKHSWKVAVDKASGVKVHDDPKLLKQSLKKEKKRRQKSAQKWKERVETQHKMKAEQQQKRSQNIADRAENKKMRKIAKREKKLLRPGFEGRKEGYVNETSIGGAAS